MTVDIVIEIAPDASALRSLLGNPGGPLEQVLVRIAATIPAAGPVEPDVRRSSARPAGRDQAFEVVRNEPNAMAVQQSQDLLVVPALVAELDDLLEVVGQAGEEGVEPLQIPMEARRQLVEQ